MERFVIEGGKQLHGTVRPNGSKNEALPVLAACLLTSEPVILKNLPRIADVEIMIEVLKSLGATVEELDRHTLRVTSGELKSLPCWMLILCRRIRASILFAGADGCSYGRGHTPTPRWRRDRSAPRRI